jgi:(p)ppGpp synthase/HD superfamily hydrolase
MIVETLNSTTASNIMSKHILSANDIYLVPAALLFAHQAHRGQTRRDMITPTFAHLSGVAQAVYNRFQGHPLERVLVATAYLHDVIEDNPGTVTVETLRNEGFPDEVVDAVVALTHGKHEPYADYIDRIATNPVATEVKIADIENNLSDNPTERQVAKYEPALLILRAAQSVRVTVNPIP